MQKINFKSNNRSILTLSQKDFLVRAIDFSWYIANQVEIKNAFFYEKGIPVSSSLIAAEIILKSAWGTSPESQGKTEVGKWGNNLVGLEADKFWSHKTVKHNGVEYKAFKDWEAFGTHWSDILIFHKKLEEFTLKTLNNSCYDNERMNLIHNFHLREFEINDIERKV